MALAEGVNHAVVIMYHRFGMHQTPTTNVSMRDFERHIAYLEKNNFNVWPLQKIVDYLRQKKPLPDRTLAICIDDAYLSVYEHAFPLLKKKGWPFTVFVATDPIDKHYKPYMSWDELREMHEAGVTIANHSRSHAHLVDRLPGENTQQWRTRVSNDIAYAQKRLQQELGFTPKLFAYPYGEFSNALQMIVKEAGYNAFGQHSGAVGVDSNFTALPRFPFSEEYSNIEDFATKVSSLPFDFQSYSPTESVLTSKSPPVLKIKFKHDIKNYRELRCYASGNHLMSTTWLGDKKNEVQVSTDARYAQRRFRYNCTLPAAKGRYYWQSFPWIQSWVPED